MHRLNEVQFGNKLYTKLLNTYQGLRILLHQNKSNTQSPIQQVCFSPFELNTNSNLSLKFNANLYQFNREQYQSDMSRNSLNSSYHRSNSSNLSSNYILQNSYHDSRFPSSTALPNSLTSVPASAEKHVRNSNSSGKNNWI